MQPDLPTVVPVLRATPAQARQAVIQDGHVSALVTTCGSVELRWYTAQDHEGQTPHDRDEIYVVVTGTARFIRETAPAPFSDDHELQLAGEDRVTVQPGDMLFVPAGTVHQFEHPSTDFSAWMLFYGPEGGEGV